MHKSDKWGNVLPGLWLSERILPRQIHRMFSKKVYFSPDKMHNR